MIFKIVRTLLETRLEVSVKKEAEKIRKGGRKNRRIRNRKTRNILKIVRRPLETKLWSIIKKEAKKIRKHGKKKKIIGNCEKTIVEAGPKDWIRKIKEAKCGKVAAKRRKNIC